MARYKFWPIYALIKTKLILRWLNLDASKSFSGSIPTPYWGHQQNRDGPLTKTYTAQNTVLVVRLNGAKLKAESGQRQPNLKLSVRQAVLKIIYAIFVFICTITCITMCVSIDEIWLYIELT